MQGTAQRFALPALGWGRRSRPARKMLRRVKLLEIAAESPASGARFVSRVFILQPIFSLDLNTRLHFPQKFSPVLLGCVTNNILFQPL